MTKSRVWILVCFSILGFGPANCVAQENESEIHVTVDMVQLNVAVTDRKGNYVTGLRPEDFIITEDGIQQEIATFGEGDEATRRLAESDPAGDKPAGSPADSARPESIGDPQALASLVAGSNVFVLFDTSNYMYRGFVFAQDAIADFIRSLQSADKVAFYSYSRDLSRATPLTADRSRILRGVRKSDRGFFQWPRQFKYGPSRGCRRTGPVDRNRYLHDQYPAGAIGAGFDRSVRTHDRRDRR